MDQRLSPDRTVIRWILPGVVVLALAACGGDPVSVASSTSRGLPDGVGSTEVIDPKPLAAWIDHGETFAIVTWGSSSCPPIPVKIKQGEATVVVDFVESTEEICSADLSPTTHTFDVPRPSSGAGITSVEVIGLGDANTLDLGAA